MNSRFNFNEKLDFRDIDLTAPEKVIEEILSQLPEETNGIILSKIQPYSGHVFSYKRAGFSGIAEALGTVDKEVDIQEELGSIGQETHKFECFLYTPEYDKYKYRIFFVKYDVANYPVDIILDESVAKSIAGPKRGYIYTCDTREELENLIYNIFGSKRIITVMQELIRINQAKRADKNNSEIENATESE